MRLFAVFLFLSFAFLTIGGECQTLAVDPSSGAPSGASTSLNGNIRAPDLQERPRRVGPEYRIGAGDVLRVSVWEEPQFNTSSIVVRPDGKISIPLISEISVAGLTPEAAEKLLAEELLKFIKHPRVTVIIEEIHSLVVYVTGEVQHPGAYPLVGPMNVVQLIARAGGVTEYAKKKDVYVLHQENGPRTKVNFQAVLQGKDLEENIGLLPGDTVVIP